MKDSNKNSHGGIPTNLFAFPLLIFVVIMLLIIIYIIIDTNHSSDELSLTMQRSSEYQIDATSMQTTNTIMSETCSTYIQTPIDINGNSNFGSQLAYSEQVNANGRAPKVVERFEQYGVSNKAGKCIKKCFGKQNDNNCYRIGGDEFIALMYDCPESTVKNRIELFKTYTEREDIDVAVGYAHTDKMENGMFKELIEKADRNMYEQKRKAHYQQNPTNDD